MRPPSSARSGAPAGRSSMALPTPPRLKAIVAPDIPASLHASRYRRVRSPASATRQAGVPSAASLLSASKNAPYLGSVTRPAGRGVDFGEGAGVAERGTGGRDSGGTPGGLVTR